MITKVKYEEMFPDEFKDVLAQNPIAYLPLGNLEWHGYHNVLGLDSLKAWKICELAAMKIGGIVFPPLYLGVDAWPDIDLQKYPNKQFDCYHLSEKVYQEVLENYFYRIERIGFKKLLVLAGHYPNFDVAKNAASSQRLEKIKIIIVKEPDLIVGETGDHAGKWETSLMIALFPQLVNLKTMEGKEDPLLAVEGNNPSEATKEYGDQKVNAMMNKIAELLKD